MNFLTALKLVRIVEIIKEIEPNLNSIKDDDIDFNQVCDNTLAIHQSLRELAMLPCTTVQAVALKSIVPVLQRTCPTFTIDELIKRFNSCLHISVPLPALNAFAPVGHNSIVPVMQRTCPTFAIDAIGRTVKIEMPHVSGQPKITYIFTEQMWQYLCSALLLFLTTTTNNITSESSIVEIGSDEDEEEEKEVEQGVYDGYVADDDNDDEESNCPSPKEIDSNNSSENASDDSDFEQMSPTALNNALFALYHKNRE